MENQKDQSTTNWKINDYITICLLALFLSCLSYALITSFNIVTNETIKNEVFVATFLISIIFLFNLEGNKKTKQNLLGATIVLIGVTIYHTQFNENNNSISNQITESSNETNTSNKESDNKNKCTICGKSFSGKGYEEVANGVWSLCKEPYQCYVCSKSCGVKHTIKMNAMVNGSGGKMQESNVCTMCKGTGIEKNTSHLTNEYGRTCPMCDGKGVKSY